MPSMCGRGEPCGIIPGSSAGWELSSAFQGSPYCLRITPASWPPGTSLVSCRAGERPELCRVSLPEFQQFLLEYQGVWLGWAWARVPGWGWRWGTGLITGWNLSHAPNPAHPYQELWAVDRFQVQEFMLDFLQDPLREIEEPYFSLDEVRSASTSPVRESGWGWPGRRWVSRSRLARGATVLTLCPPCLPQLRLSTLLPTTPMLVGQGSSPLSLPFHMYSRAVRHLPVLQREQRVEREAGCRVPGRHEQPSLPLLDLLLAQHVSSSLGPAQPDLGWGGGRALA